LGIGATGPIALFASGKKRAAEYHDAEKWLKQKERDMAAFDKDMTLRLSTSSMSQYPQSTFIYYSYYNVISLLVFRLNKLWSEKTDSLCSRSRPLC
jgi:hypothetical protein